MQMSQQVENGRNRLSEAFEQSADAVREHPVGSTSLAFGIGLGVGFLLVQILQHEQPRARRDFGAAQELGHKILDAVRQMVPDAVARHMP